MGARSLSNGGLTVIYERTTADDTGGSLTLPITVNTNVMKYFELRWSYKTNATVTAGSSNMALSNLTPSGFLSTDASNLTGGLFRTYIGGTNAVTCTTSDASNTIYLGTTGLDVKLSSFVNGTIRFYISPQAGFQPLCKIVSEISYIDTTNARRYTELIGNYLHNLGDYTTTARLRIGQLTANPIQSLHAIMLGSVR